MMFITNPDTVDCARDLDDSRLGPVCLFTGKVICTILKKKKKLDVPYDSIKGPWIDWAYDRDNFAWVVSYHKAVADEYKRRFGRHPQSFKDVGREFFDTIPQVRVLDDVPALAFDAKTGQDFTWVINPFESYRYLLNFYWLNEDPQWNRNPCVNPAGKMPKELPKNWAFYHDEKPTWLTPRYGILESARHFISLFKTGRSPKGCTRCGEIMKWKVYENDAIEISCSRAKRFYDCIRAKEITILV